MGSVTSLYPRSHQALQRNTLRTVFQASVFALSLSICRKKNLSYYLHPERAANGSQNGAGWSAQGRIRLAIEPKPPIGVDQTSVRRYSVFTWRMTETHTRDLYSRLTPAHATTETAPGIGPDSPHAGWQWLQAVPQLLAMCHEPCGFLPYP